MTIEMNRKKKKQTLETEASIACEIRLFVDFFQHQPEIIRYA